MNKLRKLFFYIFSKKKLNHNNSEKSFDEIYNDHGVFKYNESGFFIDCENFHNNIKWEEITELNVYKKDLITIDQIEMEIFCGDKYFVITEELPGWFQFISKTKEVFPTIPKDWDLNIIEPSFERNYTTIYRK